MEYAETWYGDNSTLALSIYGKRAASSCPQRGRRCFGVSTRCRARQLSEVVSKCRKRSLRGCVETVHCRRGLRPGRSRAAGGVVVEAGLRQAGGRSRR